MKRNENTPFRLRTVLEDVYAKYGQPDFQFKIYCPFTAEMFEAAAEVGANPAGLSNQSNQVLAENLSNNIAAKIRKADKDGSPLPTQEDMDVLYDSYDFSGTRSAGPGRVSVGLFDRIFSRLASAFVKRLIKAKGYKDLPPGVTVAKRDEEPVGNQISFEDFEAEVDNLIEGTGPWAEIPAFIEVRDSLISDAREEEATVKAREVKAERKLAGLGL